MTTITKNNLGENTTIDVVKSSFFSAHLMVRRPDNKRESIRNYSYLTTLFLSLFGVKTTKFQDLTTKNFYYISTKDYEHLTKSSMQKVIDYLQKADPVSQLKAKIYAQGMQLFADKGCHSHSLKTFELDSKEKVNFNTDKRQPAYFKEIYKKDNQTQTFFSEASYYTYREDQDQEEYKKQVAYEHIYVDFANAKLGGGCFVHGFVQEEIMVAEMPDFAAHLADRQDELHWCKILIREGGRKDRNRVGKGSPTPHFLKGVQRVQQVDNEKAYGDKLATLDQQSILTAVTPLDTVQTVNILAIAAPKLEAKDIIQQWNEGTLQDIFNTLAAGLTLVNKNREELRPVVIHSGRLGCGVFNNDPLAVYLLHRLASVHFNTHLHLHGYSNQDNTKFNQIWEDLNGRLEHKSLADCLAYIAQPDSDTELHAYRNPLINKE